MTVNCAGVAVEIRNARSYAYLLVSLSDLTMSCLLRPVIQAHASDLKWSSHAPSRLVVLQ